MLGNHDVGAQGIANAQPTSYSLDRSGNDLTRSCQLQLEQLLTQGPIVAIWMVSYLPERGPRVVRVPSTRESPVLDFTTMAYLESEVWLTDGWPLLKLRLLPIADHAIYSCILGQGSHAEYLLIWTATLLSEFQQHTVEQHAQLLHHWLLVDRDLARQRGEIQLLEQILQRAEHQLRNPLAVISLYAENLRLELADGLLHEQATVIRDTVSELSRNLTDLIHCGQRSTLRVAPHDLRALLIDSIRSVEPWLEQKQLQVNYPESPVCLVMDGWQMKQVLSNLLNNAIHFSPNQGTVTWNWCIFQNEVLIELRDQGPGLSEEDLQHAFTPFYTRRPGGTGLGLAIAKKIIFDHQGSLWVQNLPGGGAQFSFTLPRHGNEIRG